MAMASGPIQLGSCRECRREVSTNAGACPHCGAPKPADHKWNGWGFDWKSKTSFYGWPLIHVSVGKDRNGKLRVAKGWVAIGQFGIGLVTVAQFGIGVLFGFGQFILGITAIAQFAAALLFGLGQFVSGYVAIGQIAFGYYALCQTGYGIHLWSQKVADPEAVRFFLDLKRQILMVWDKS
jgi:hypothetical protein